MYKLEQDQSYSSIFCLFFPLVVAEAVPLPNLVQRDLASFHNDLSKSQ